MIRVYRLVRAARADDAFTGEGARRYGGRWNPPKHPVVYTSQSRALAALEAFVHLTMEARTMRFVVFEIILPRAAKVREHGAPARGRRQGREPAASQQAGREWIEEGAALAYVVPSVIVPQERNYVLNVRHPQFARLRMSKAEPFSFDSRLWKS